MYFVQQTKNQIMVHYLNGKMPLKMSLNRKFLKIEVPLYYENTISV